MTSKSTLPNQPLSVCSGAKALIFPCAWLALLVNFAGADDPPSPEALLRGVVSARLEHTAFKVTIHPSPRAPSEAGRLSFRVEVDGDRRRFEQIGRYRTDPDSIVVRNGEQIHVYGRGASSIYRYDADETNVGYSDFDPRLLGLARALAPDVRVQDVVWIESAAKLSIVGRERINDTEVWVVRAERERDGILATLEHWVEEPLLRVHKAIGISRLPTSEIRSTTIIESEFDPADASSPFPRRVHVTNSSLRRPPREMEYIVGPFEIVEKIPDERFSLQSLDLP